MPILFGSKLSSAVANDTFLDKTIADIKTGQLTLRKSASDPTPVSDAQQAILDLQNLTNTDLVNGVIKIRQYISDSAYQSANGTPSGGEFYYNSTTGLVRYYDGVDSQWKPIGEQVIGVQEDIGTGNGSNTDFTITNAPLNDEAVNVFANGVIVQKSDYTYNAPNVEFNTAPAAGVKIYVSYLSNGSPASPIVSAGTNNVQYYTLQAADITAASFTLASAPSVNTQTLVDVVGGSTAQYGVDFTITGTTFDFSGLGLDGVLSAGDVLRIQYFT